MHNRITAAIARAEIPKNLVDVCVAKRLDDVVDKSCEWLVVQLRAGDLFKEISQKRICARNKLSGILACEFPTGPGSTRRKKPVGQGLREHVRKLGDSFALLFRVGIRG